MERMTLVVALIIISTGIIGASMHLKKVSSPNHFDRLIQSPAALVLFYHEAGCQSSWATRKAERLIARLSARQRYRIGLPMVKVNLCKKKFAAMSEQYAIASTTIALFGSGKLLAKRDEKISYDQLIDLIEQWLGPELDDAMDIWQERREEQQASTYFYIGGALPCYYPWYPYGWYGGCYPCGFGFGANWYW